MHRARKRLVKLAKKHGVVLRQSYSRRAAHDARAAFGPHPQHVVNLGGYRGAAGFGVYSSTKFAVEGLSEALHAELAPLGVHATAVEPGYFRTDFLNATSRSISSASIAD